MALAVRSSKRLPYSGGSKAGAHALIEAISCSPFPASSRWELRFNRKVGSSEKPMNAALAYVAESMCAERGPDVHAGCRTRSCPTMPQSYTYHSWEFDWLDFYAEREHGRR